MISFFILRQFFFFLPSFFSAKALALLVSKILLFRPAFFFSRSPTFESFAEKKKKLNKLAALIALPEFTFERWSSRGFSERNLQSKKQNVCTRRFCFCVSSKPPEGKVEWTAGMASEYPRGYRWKMISFYRYLITTVFPFFSFTLFLSDRPPTIGEIFNYKFTKIREQMEELGVGRW